MNDYLFAQEGMKNMLDSIDDPLGGFKKKIYASRFETLYEKHVPVMDAIERLYTSVGEPDTLIDNMAGALVETAAGRVNSHTKKGKKESELMQLNMTMVVYVFPLLLKYKGTSSRPLVDRILSKWKEEFPKTNLQPAEYEYIEKGFHKKFCYITTAVCETFHKPDDCYELTLLRGYRDQYLAALPEGGEVIQKYYDVAPTIVKHINRCEDSAAIYEGIWKEYLSPCITLIENGKNEECKEHYIEMVETLKQRYFYMQ